MAAAVAALRRRGMTKLIWDVRGNPGGLLDAAVDVLDLFVDRGVLVSTRGPGRRPDADLPARPAGEPLTRCGTWRSCCWSTGTAPAPARSSPAVCGTTSRGLIVGRTTYGKWSVQSIIDLSRRRTRREPGRRGPGRRDEADHGPLLQPPRIGTTPRSACDPDVDRAGVHRGSADDPSCTTTPWPTAQSLPGPQRGSVRRRRPGRWRPWRQPPRRSPPRPLGRRRPAGPADQPAAERAAGRPRRPGTAPPVVPPGDPAGPAARPTRRTPLPPGGRRAAVRGLPRRLSPPPARVPLKNGGRLCVRPDAGRLGPFFRSFRPGGVEKQTGFAAHTPGRRPGLRTVAATCAAAGLAAGAAAVMSLLILAAGDDRREQVAQSVHGDVHLAAVGPLVRRRSRLRWPLSNVLRSVRPTSAVAVRFSGRSFSMRSRIRSSWAICSKTPAVCQRRACWQAACHGGKSFGSIRLGSIRQGTPLRTR